MGIVTSSGSIKLVINVPTDMDLDYVDVVATLADASFRSGKQLNDRDYFSEEVSNVGLVELLGLRDWDDLKPGLWLVEGHLWSEKIESIDYGTDYDGGFEVEEAEPLTDVQALVADWLEDKNDLGLCEQLRSELMSVDPGVRETARQRLDVLQEVLCVLRELVQREDASSDV